MDLVDWQQRFERWILTHHAQDDAAHDLSHFRRVWATATQLAAGEEVDRLVLLTACYFHDIVSLPKNHPERSRSSMMAAEKTSPFCSRPLLIFLRIVTRRSAMPSRRTASARRSHRARWRRK
ncbi:HD domain-containing protein [Klebsiella pneumoniae]|nr:HD domain-containing protein [Klebsiella pneumoniae]